MAQEKARTGDPVQAALGGALEKVVLDGKVHMMTLPGATPIEGGLPIVWRDTFVGAIGISGVQSFQGRDPVPRPASMRCRGEVMATTRGRMSPCRRRAR